jgi:hypothetical protein
MNKNDNLAQDIRGLRDLTPDSVRDILRASLRDPTLTLTTMGALQDISGTNDAFNSSICSLEVISVRQIWRFVLGFYQMNFIKCT